MLRYQFILTLQGIYVPLTLWGGMAIPLREVWPNVSKLRNSVDSRTLQQMVVVETYNKRLCHTSGPYISITICQMLCTMYLIKSGSYQRHKKSAIDALFIIIPTSFHSAVVSCFMYFLLSISTGPLGSIHCALIWLFLSFFLHFGSFSSLCTCIISWICLFSNL